eukprot:1160802-Pelagomonas_calceolata.AAC.12
MLFKTHTASFGHMFSFPRVIRATQGFAAHEVHVPLKGTLSLRELGSSSVGPIEHRPRAGARFRTEPAQAQFYCLAQFECHEYLTAGHATAYHHLASNVKKKFQSLAPDTHSCSHKCPQARAAFILANYKKMFTPKIKD